MNRRIIFIIALILVLLLHLGAGIIMLHDEKNRIKSYLQLPESAIIQLIPETQLPPLSLDDSEDATEQSENEEIESAEEEPQGTEEDSPETTALDEEKNSNKDKEEEASKETPKRNDREASYRQNISKGGDLMREKILPPREDGGYSRTVSTDEDPYKKLVDDAITLLEETPFLDKEWKDQVASEDEPIQYSREFIELLKKYNPTEPIQKNDEPETDEIPTPEEAELSELDRFGNPKPVTLIVNQLNPPIDLAEIEALAQKKEAEKERLHSTNIINAAGSQIRRKEYNVSLTSSQCYDTYIKGSNRKYSAVVMIFDNPKGVGIYRSTGNLQLDSCIIEMTNQFIDLPAEMERIRKHAPRMGNGKGYLLNATF